MRNIPQHAGRLAALLVLLSLSGCVGYGHGLRDVEAALRRGQPQEALLRLEGLGRGVRNEALYHVNRGMLLRASGDIEASIDAFEAAKPLLEYQEATSISETAGRLVLAEGTTSYQPRPFERLQLHVLQALNHLELGDWDAARVEANQVDLYLRRRFDGAEPQGADAFARYLSGIIYEGLGERSDALIAYRKALQAYDRNGTVARIPEDLERRLLVYTRRLGADEEYAKLAERFGEKRVAEADELAEALADEQQAELVAVAMTGLVPRRYEVSSLHQDFRSGKVYRLSLPALQLRTGRSSGVVLRASGEVLARSQPVENLDVAARRALEDEMPGLIARAIARNLAKNRLANEAGEESSGAEFLVNLASAMLENADVRSWSTLPESIHLLRTMLPVGEHDLELVFTGSERTRSLHGVKLDRGRPTVIGINELGSKGELAQ